METFNELKKPTKFF